ncbi:MAG: hypothetical protein RL497_271 [Pseudomonadota bacterium]
MVINPTYNPRNPTVAGVVLFLLLSSGFAQADTLPAQCLSGFEAHKSDGSLPDTFIERPAGGFNDAEIQPTIKQWMAAQRWQASYHLWQQARLCRSGFSAAKGGLCANPALPLPPEDLCQGPQDGFAFLAMHRHLLHSLRALWPSLNDQFAGWRRFPAREDYPVMLQNHFKPWPEAVRRAAEAVDRIPKMSRTQLLARWKTEGEFGQWIQCGGTSGGVMVDSLNAALLTNASSGQFNDAAASGLNVADQSPLDLYLFWKAHGWIDKAWDRYRKALGKTPDDPQLQAALINQCQIQTTWAEYAARLSTPAAPPPTVDAPLFANGELNPRYSGQWANVLGEVEAVMVREGKPYIKLNLRLVGVKPIWVSSHAPLAVERIKLGERYWVAGSVQRSANLDPSGQLAANLNSAHLLLATSIQTAK